MNNRRMPNWLVVAVFMRPTGWHFQNVVIPTVWLRCTVSREVCFKAKIYCDSFTNCT